MKYKYKIFPFLKHYKRKKDGKRQLMLRVKIGYAILGRITYEKEVDIKVLNSAEEPIKLTEQEFNNRKSNSELMGRLYEVEGLITRAIYILRNENLEINAKNLFKGTYTQTLKINDEDELIETDETKLFYDHPIPKKVWETFQAESFYDDETKGVMLLEEVEDIATNIEGNYFGEKLKKEEEELVSKMDYHERYKKGYYDKNNIFDCFGFCWTRNPKNNDVLVPKCYKGLLLRLHDYKFNNNPPESIKEFNQEWIDNFLIFLVNEGYSSYMPKGYEPFKFDKYKLKLVTSDRIPYRYSGFQKIVKLLKRYIALMKKYQIIDVKIDQTLIEAKEYLSRDDVKVNYTRKEHSLTANEFELLTKTDFKDDRLNVARDMFIIAVLGGGFRGEEFYNQKLKIEKRDSGYLLHAYRSKTDTIFTNIVFGELKNVIKKNNGGLPKFLRVEDFRKALSEIAYLLKFDRIITSPDTTLGTKNKTIDYVLKDIFSIYFARKTCSTVLEHYGIPKDKILDFMSLTKEETYNHYKASLTISSKEKILEKHGLL